MDHNGTLRTSLHQISPNRKSEARDVRHFGFSNDERGNDYTPDQDRPKVNKSRKDTEAHFEFQDDGTPVADRQHPAGQLRGSKLYKGLYADNVLGDDGQDQQEQPLGTITNQAGRRKDFASHWAATDDSPQSNRKQTKNIGADQQKHIKAMNANWDTYDESPEPTKTQNQPLRKGMESHWGFENQTPAKNATSNGRAADKSFWDF